MEKKTEAPILAFATKEEFRKWLHEHYESPIGIWLKFAKKNSNIPSIRPEESLEVALCYGWIDGQRKSMDEDFFMNKYTPRRKASLWSKKNCDIAERLIREKKMQPSGLKEINLAKADGRWDRAYEGQKNIEVPPDFVERVKKSPSAYKFFKTLNRSNLFAIAFRLQTAKKPEIRENRLMKILEMMEKGEKLQ